MHRHPNRAVVFAALAAGVCAAVIAVSPPAAGQDAASTFLGFEVEEERRYVLGPLEALGQSESGTWLIRLAEVTRSDGELHGVFALEHTWHIAVLGRPIPPGTVTAVESSGSIRVNGHGFPLLIEIRTKRQLAGVGDEAYTTRFEYDDGEYRKVVTGTRSSQEDDVGIRENRHVDFDVPAGVFAYLPGPPECFVGQPRSKPADNSDCEESLFANPGLLGFVIPALWEAAGEREFVFFTPIGPVGDRSWRAQAVQTTPGRPPVGSPPVGGLQPEGGRLMYQPITPFSYHEIETLRYGERTSIRLGRRRMDVWTIQGPGQLLAIYADDDGRVVRVDLPKRDDLDPGRWIRLLLPSEY